MGVFKQLRANLPMANAKARTMNQRESTLITAHQREPLVFAMINLSRLFVTNFQTQCFMMISLVRTCHRCITQQNKEKDDAV
jgi:hypothetical protein